MDDQQRVALDGQIAAHAALAAADMARLRSLNLRERGRLIEAACEAAAAIERSRRAAGLPPTPRAPWPASTWEFLRKQAARVRS